MIDDTNAQNGLTSGPEQDALSVPKPSVERKSYSTPELQLHGRFEAVTLQTSPDIADMGGPL